MNKTIEPEPQELHLIKTSELQMYYRELHKKDVIIQELKSQISFMYKLMKDITMTEKVLTEMKEYTATNTLG